MTPATLARLAPPRVRCGRAPISGATRPHSIVPAVLENLAGGGIQLQVHCRSWASRASAGTARLTRRWARGYTAPSPTHGHGLEIDRGFDERFYPGGIVDSHPEFGGAHPVARRAARFRPVPGADERRIRLGPRGVRLRH